MITTSALAARLMVDSKTLRSAVARARRTPTEARDARQAALARARTTPGGYLRWTAADADAVAAAFGHAATDGAAAAPTPRAIAPASDDGLIAYLLRVPPHEEDAETEALALMGALMRARDASRSVLTATELVAMSERATALGHELLRAALRRVKVLQSEIGEGS